MIVTWTSCFVEKNVNGKWEQIKDFISDYYDPDSKYFSGTQFKNTDSPIDRRNYTLFALLANVRNGYGFAGIDTGDAIKPISMPKGLPKDISENIKKESDECGCDGHSHSWLTIKEILDYKSGVKISRGVVSENEYKTYKEKGRPKSWCGMVSGANILVVSENEFEKTIKDNPYKDVYCRIEWAETIENCLSYFFTNSLKQLKERCDLKDYSDVRIVFWFNN